MSWAVRILIIDDSEEQRLALQSYLHQEGHRDVLLAESVSEAMSLLQDQTAVDLVLLKDLMAGTSGPETCHLIKDQPCLKDASIIMVTANEDADSLNEAFQAGAADYIVSPPDPVQLKARLNS
ncbi:MAG: response regulator, partial [Deltaproteobacteria bacterium]|nr:response regulator [Deltaproteobacteria bacterium]